MSQLIGIARRGAPRAPMEELELGVVTTAEGLAGDHKGLKFPRRQITVMSREGLSPLAAIVVLHGSISESDRPHRLARA